MKRDVEPRQRAIELFNQAYRAQMRGRLETAVRLYQRSIECCPTAEAHTFLGWTYSFTGHLDQAIEECLKAIQADPDFGNPYNDIGAYLIEKGQLDEAIPWLEKALTAPRYDCYAFPHMNLGRVYERKGAWDKALRHYKLALEKKSDYRPAAKALARLRGMMN